MTTFFTKLASAVTALALIGTVIPMSVLAAPAAPTLTFPLDGASLTDEELTKLDWEGAAEAVTYTYEVSFTDTADGDFASAIYTQSGIADTELPTGSNAEGTYYWHIRGVDTEGNPGAWSETFMFSVVPPPAPGDNGMWYVDDSNAGTEDGTFAQPFNTIEEGVTAAGVGETVSIANGAYALSGTLTLSEAGMSLIGESEAGVVITAAPSGYGIAPSADSITLERFTLNGPSVLASGNYGIKAYNLASMTIRDVTVQGSGRTEVDLNAVTNSTLENVTADGMNTPGVGIGLSNVTNVTLDSVTTQGNAWGGVGLYDYSTGPTTDVSFAGGDFNEANPIYIDAQYGFGASAISLPSGYDYAVRNTSHRPNGGNFTYFESSEDDAVEAALAYQNAPYAVNMVSTIQTVAGNGSLENEFFVGEGMAIQAAVDLASNGGIVTLGEGTFDENVITTSSLSFVGAGVGDTTVSPTAGSAFYLNANASFEGISMTGTGSQRGIEVANGAIELSVEDLETSNLLTGIYLNPGNIADILNFVSTENVAGIGIDQAQVTVENGTFTGSTDEAIGFTAAGAQTITISGSSFSGNAFAIKGYSAWPTQYVGADIFVSAPENWWGDATGPSHAANVGGVGDAVTDGVMYSPFCVDTDCDNNSDDDLTAPVITLLGDATVTIEEGDVYVDAGATAQDNVDGDISAEIEVDGAVDSSEDGVYELTYTVTDAAGNDASPVTRTIIVNDVDAPVITLLGDATITIDEGDDFTDPGATAFDETDNAAVAVVVSGSVNTLDGGTYTLTYTAEDSEGNVSTATRTVIVNEQGSRGGSGGSGSSNRRTVNNNSNANANASPTGQVNSVTPGQGQVLGASTYNFTADLTVGSMGADVNALQQMLIDAGLLMIPAPTGWFGPMTQAALAKWQAAHGVTPAVGYFGPITRAAILAANAGSTTSN
ncbi:MAG: immunoglobulin-like domain-containing protein [Patescibacteria group bacterium]